MCTVEAMPLDLKVDFLAVDEVQLAADRERGHVFTDRIEHARGRLETWLLGAETVRPLLHKLLPDAAFTTRPRLSTLSSSEPKRLGKLPPRTAVIVFSVRELYEVAARLRREQGGAALVFGALSPRTRNAQVGLYQAGEVDLLVATDAIGMGLNLDIDHVVFTGLTKFDGVGPRPLTPAEVGQVAGRAGRHVRDGHFAPTTELGPFDRAWWTRSRSTASRPSPTSTGGPTRSTSSRRSRSSAASTARRRSRSSCACGTPRTRRRSPPSPATRSVMALARDPDSVRLLWEVCQVPDFQGVVTEGHTRLLSRVFRFLREPAARIPEDFLASHVKDIDRAEGDVETLLGRIAAIRTWTYISHRGSWVPDARFWQERTRAVEDRLSDALHERLTQEFVDRPGTVIARHDPSELVTSVGGDGEVLVQGLRAGVLDGFRFRPDREVRESSRGLLAAANRSLSALVRERVEALEREDDASLALGPGAEVLWRGAAVARLVAGEGALQPQVDVARERPPRPAAAGARAAPPRRLARVAPARGAPPALRPPRRRAPPGSSAASPSPSSRGSARSRVAPWRSRSPPSRRTIGRRWPAWGSRSAASRSSSPRCCARRPRACGRASLPCGRDARPRAAPTARRPSRSTPRQPAAFYLACGYLPAGPRAVRLDRLERAAAVASRLSRDGPFVPPRDLAPILGCPPDEVPAVLTAIGYVEKDGRFERRRRRGQVESA